MFDFIKNLFKKEEKTAAVKLDNLEQYFKDIKEQQLKPLNEIISKFYSEVKEILDSLPEKLDTLESSTIGKEDQSQPDRIKNIVLGHKNQYSKLTRIFLERVKIEDDVNNVLEFLDKFEKELDEYGKATFKSYRAAQHLYFKPVEAVSNSFKQINNKIKLLKKQFDKYKYTEILELETDIRNFFENLNKKEDLEKEQQNRKKALKEDKKLMAEKQNQLLTLQNSEEIKQFKSLQEQKFNLNNQLKQIEASIIERFAYLERALRKYSKIAVDSKLVNSYITNPVVSLINDREKNIIAVLAGLKRSLDKLGLKNTEKIREAIDEILDTNVLDKLQQNYAAIIRSIGETDTRIKEFDILERTDNLRIEIARIKKDIERKQAESLDMPEAEVAPIEEKFFKLFNIKLSIK
ncbi:hypothetical protein KY337_01625 [Candidatus Woesearchaeota archaeon]|nr:hypothetical protein [Candidatus Woesearchaeota archaeon]